MTAEAKLIEVGADGVSRLFEWGGLVTVLILVILGLIALCVYLVKRNNELADKFVVALVDTTKALVELKGSVDAFKEALRYVQKN